MTKKNNKSEYNQPRIEVRHDVETMRLVEEYIQAHPEATKAGIMRKLLLETVRGERELPMSLENKAYRRNEIINVPHSVTMKEEEVEEIEDYISSKSFVSKQMFIRAVLKHNLPRILGAEDDGKS